MLWFLSLSTMPSQPLAYPFLSAHLNSLSGLADHPTDSPRWLCPGALHPLLEAFCSAALLMPRALEPS